MEVEKHDWRMRYLSIMRGFVGSFSLLSVSNLYQSTALFSSLWKRKRLGTTKNRITCKFVSFIFENPEGQ